jgi:hypothetical protein
VMTIQSKRTVSARYKGKFAKGTSKEKEGSNSREYCKETSAAGRCFGRTRSRGSGSCAVRRSSSSGSSCCSRTRRSSTSRWLWYSNGGQGALLDGFISIQRESKYVKGSHSDDKTARYKLVHVRLQSGQDCWGEQLRRVGLKACETILERLGDLWSANG